MIRQSWWVGLAPRGKGYTSPRAIVVALISCCRISGRQGCTQDPRSDVHQRNTCQKPLILNFVEAFADTSAECHWQTCCQCFFWVDARKSVTPVFVFFVVKLVDRIYCLGWFIADRWRCRGFCIRVHRCDSFLIKAHSYVRRILRNNKELIVLPHSH